MNVPLLPNRRQVLETLSSEDANHSGRYYFQTLRFETLKLFFCLKPTLILSFSSSLFLSFFLSFSLSFIFLSLSLISLSLCLSRPKIRRSSKGSKLSNINAPYIEEQTISTQVQLTPVDACPSMQLTTADRRKRLSSGSSLGRKRSDSPTIMDMISLPDEEDEDAINRDANIPDANIPDANIGDANQTLSISCPNNIHILVDPKRRQNLSVSKNQVERLSDQRFRAPSGSSTHVVGGAPKKRSSHAQNIATSIQYKSGYAQMHQQTTARKQVNYQVD